MKLATFNCNSIRSRLPIVIDWLRENAPDVLCLQETKVVDRDFPREAFTQAGYHVVFRGEPAYNGVAVATRREPRAVAFGFDDGEPPDETRLVYVCVDGVHVVNTYVPQGRDITHAMYGYKLRWLARLRAWFDRHLSTRRRVAWVGDMNVAPDAVDIHNAERQTEHVCYHADVRRAFAETVAWGFRDVFRERHPGERDYTFFDYRTLNAVQRNMGWRIDHILCTPPLARRCSGAWIDRAPRLRPKPSDHTFLAATFDVSAAE